MSKDFSRASALLQTVDSLILKHGSEHPELARDLAALRADLQLALERRDSRETAMLALRIASWVRYVVEIFIDH